MTTHILRIDSSIFGEHGQSSQLASYTIDKLSQSLKASDAAVNVTHRDFAADPAPHFSAATVDAVQKGEADLADEYITELQNADIVVLSAPMYNFGIPSTLKAWFDHVARAGTTFQYTDQGPKGLLTDKKVYVITTRGGQHQDSPRDAVVPQVATFLGFLGMTDVDVIYAEGLAMSANKDNSVSLAKNHIDELISSNREQVIA